MGYYGQDPSTEIAWIEGLDRARIQAQDAASNWDLVKVLRAAHIARLAPWIQPGVMLTMAKGLDSLEPLHAVALASAQQKVQDNPTNRDPGDMVYGRELNPGDRRLFQPNTTGRRPLGNINMEMREAKDTSQAFSANAPPEIKAAADAGLIDHANNIHMPSGHFEGFDSKTNSYKYSGDQEKWRTFLNLVDYLQANNKDLNAPIPVIQNGQPGIYDPYLRTFTNQAQNGHASIGPLGMVAEQAGRGIGNLAQLIGSHRLPQQPNVPILSDIANLGGNEPRTVGEAIGQPAHNLNAYLQTHGPPHLPGALGSAQQTNVEASGYTGPSNFNQTIQQANMAMAAPLQEVNGQIRNIYGAATGRDVNWWEPQSDFGIWATTGMDPGKGWLVSPDSQVAQERRRREAERGLIDGHTFTLGRGLAHGAANLGIVEPDSAAYNIMSGIVDGAFALKADPFVFASNKMEAIQEARTLLKPDEAEKVGLIKGLWTNDIWRPRVSAFLDSNPGSKFISALAGEDNPGVIWKMLGRKNYVSRELVNSLADAHTDEEVRAVIEPLMGGQIRSTRDLWTNTNILNPSKYMPDSAKMWVQNQLIDVPAYFVNPYDDASVMHQTEQWLVNSHVKPEKINEFLANVAKAKNPGETLNALDGMMRHSEGVLAANGVPKELIDKLVTGWRQDLRNAQGKQLEAALDHIQSLDEIKIGEDIFGTGSPLLWAEQQAQMISLPDHNAWKALSSELPNIAYNAEGKLVMPLAKLEDFQNKLWKPFQLIRLAWPVRVIGDEQARMGAAGFASFFKDQLTYIAMAIGRKQALDLTPMEAAEDYQKAMTKGRAGGFLQEAPNRARTGAKTVLSQTDDGFADAWAKEIVELHHDKIAPKMAQDGLDATTNHFLYGGGQGTWKEFYTDPHPALENQGVANTYFESISRRIRAKTNGDSELLDAIRTGQYKGKAIFDEATMSPTADFVNALNDPNVMSGAPDKVVGVADMSHAKKKDPFVTRMFSLLMAVPSNVLSRSPVFRQAYWNRIAEMMPFADPAEKARIVANAREAYQLDWGPVHLGKGFVDKLEKSQSVGKLTLEEMDSYAKGFALDTTQDLLYDLSRKSQIADSMRLVSPFAEAWKEVYSVWAKLLNPTTGQGLKNVRRLSQFYQAALSPEAGGLFGAPTDLAGNQMGMFWRDQYGDMNFVYPGTQWLTGQKWAHVPDWVPGAGGFGAPGIPVPLTGRVMGLNMFGTLVPGLGPVAAIPASYMIQDKPGWERTLRDLVLPFGSATDQQGAFALGQITNFAPAWMRNGLQALAGHGIDQQTNRLYANTVMSAANYLYSTGKYDTKSVGGWQKLMDDAKKSARNLYLVKAMVGFGAPAAPRTDFLVDTNRGLIRYAALRDKYQSMLADPHIGIANADEEFLKQFGDQVGMTMQSFTREIQGGVGVSKQFDDWSRAHPDLKQLYPATYAYFGPQNKGKFDYNVYLKEILTGGREQLTPDEWRRLGENHLGQMILDNAKAQVGVDPTPEDQQYLDDLKDWVYKNYPGFNDFRGIEGRADPEVVMRELQAAVNDPKVNKTNAGKGLVAYMKARDDVMGTVADNGDKTFQGQDYAGDRQYLFDTGQFLSKKYKDFEALWNRVLRNEVEPTDQTNVG